jgi:hypothetical protein
VATALNEAVADLILENCPLKKKHERRRGRTAHTIAASGEPQIIPLVEQSHLPTKCAWDKPGIPARQVLRGYHRYTVVSLPTAAGAMLNGELGYRKGNYDAAFAHLRRSVGFSDSLPYHEPWGWMQPTRHALGALLLKQGRIEEAEEVYRSDPGLDGKLSRACQPPITCGRYTDCTNVWSVAEKGRDSSDQAAARQARAENPIKAPCFCRRMDMAAA